MRNIDHPFILCSEEIKNWINFYDGFSHGLSKDKSHRKQISSRLTMRFFLIMHSSTLEKSLLQFSLSTAPLIDLSHWQFYSLRNLARALPLLEAFGRQRAQRYLCVSRGDARHAGESKQRHKSPARRYRFRSEEKNISNSESEERARLAKAQGTIKKEDKKARQPIAIVEVIFIEYTDAEGNGITAKGTSSPGRSSDGED